MIIYFFTSGQFFYFNFIFLISSAFCFRVAFLSAVGCVLFAHAVLSGLIDSLVARSTVINSNNEHRNSNTAFVAGCRCLLLLLLLLSLSIPRNGDENKIKSNEENKWTTKSRCEQRPSIIINTLQNADVGPLATVF